MFEHEPVKVIYLYGAWQDKFSSMEKNYNVQFYNGIPNSETLNKAIQSKQPKLLVIDDMMCSAASSDVIHDLFYKNSHHSNTSVILIVQNLFAKNLRGISLNCHYLILFKSPRDIGQISRLGGQLGISKLLKSAYSDVCQKPYSHLVIDLHPRGDSEYMLRSDIFQDPIVYKEY